MAEKATKTAPKAKKPAAKKAPAKTAAKKVTTKSTMAEEFSIIETGAKQYIVCVGDIIEVELLGNHEEGDKIEFDKVLMSEHGKDTTIGTPYIKGAKVKATFLGEKKGKKVTIIRYKAKSNRSRKVGGRKRNAIVQIDAI